ncbi:MAG: GHMP kinase, partial [Candidatus Acidiferrales bacterium]
MLIRAKAPLRLSFAGGGTDVRPFVDEEGGCVLNATITRHAWGTLSSREDGQIEIESADFGSRLQLDTSSDLIYDGKMDLAKAAIQNLGGRDSRGFNLYLQTDAPPGSGLGSSSSLMVCLVGLLRDFKGLALSDYQTAELACRMEREQLGIPGGMQDQYAAAFGGFNFIEFSKDRVIVNPLRISQD